MLSSICINMIRGHTWLSLCHEYITLNIVIAFCGQSDGSQHGQLFSNIFILGSKRHFHLLLHMYIGSLACDPWRGFLRSPTTRHISKGDQVRNIILIRCRSTALNVSTLIIIPRLALICTTLYKYVMNIAYWLPIIEGDTHYTVYCDVLSWKVV